MDYTHDQLQADRAIKQRARELSDRGVAPTFDQQLLSWGASTRWIDQQLTDIDELLALLDAADEVAQSGS